jgi:hypothetical protein
MRDGTRRAAARRTERFAELVERAERLRVRGLRFDELRELRALYRHHSAALAAAREHGDDPDAVRYLNALCVRAYTALFARALRRVWYVALRDALAGPGARRCWRGRCSARPGARSRAGGRSGGGARAGARVTGYSSASSTAAVALAREVFFTAQETPAAHKVFGSICSRNTRRPAAFATGMLADPHRCCNSQRAVLVRSPRSSCTTVAPALLVWIHHTDPGATAISLHGRDCSSAPQWFSRRVRSGS